MSDINYADIHELWESGYVQEANRQFFHPHGLALEVSDANGDDRYDTLRVWDYRDDPEGIAFADNQISPSRTAIVDAEWQRHAEARRRLFGHDGPQMASDRIDPAAFVPKEVHPDGE